jgi:hypothetical protein
MFVREQPRRARVGEDRVKERTRDIALQQAVPVLTKGGRRPDWVIHAEADKPPVQHAVVDLLHQQPLAAHRVERLNQQGPQQLLRRNRRPADVGVHLRESRRQRGEHLVGHAPNRAQRMVRAHAPSLVGRMIRQRGCARLDILRCRDRTVVTPSGRAGIRPAARPRRHFSDTAPMLRPFFVQSYTVTAAARQPVGTGSAQIR